MLLNIIIVSAILPIVLSYNHPHCDSWPDSTAWESLESQLASSILHGPFKGGFDYVRNCYIPAQDRISLLSGHYGLCVAEHPCSHEFCQIDEGMNLPRYTVQVMDADDLPVLLEFASTHDLAVSVKSSGHSFEGQSMIADSLLLWMRHLPFTNTITDEFVDSCNTNHGASIHVAGGENFDDVFLAIKNGYHLASGSCQTVTLGGGWLLGGGTSWTSRAYGFGVDNVLQINVVLADGTPMTVDACSEPDLFWALRGGGGGTFGIVTGLEYKLHPPTKIVLLEFKYAGRQLFFKDDNEREFARAWLDLLFEEMQGSLDNRWGGNWNPLGALFLFAGTLQEALDSTWLQQLEDFYTSVEHLDLNFDRPSDLLEEFDGFHDFNGGDDCYENPSCDTTAQAVPFSYEDGYSRLIPLEVLQDKHEQFRDLVIDMWMDGDIIHPENYLFGGKTMEVGPEETSVHPAMRNSPLELRIRNKEGADRMDQEILQSYDWGVCYNHHSSSESNYEQACWGTNYERLLELKKQYDPNHRFNVYHGVGHKADDELVSNDGCYRKKISGFWPRIFFYFKWTPNLIGKEATGVFRAILDTFYVIFNFLWPF